MEFQIPLIDKALTLKRKYEAPIETFILFFIAGLVLGLLL